MPVNSADGHPWLTGAPWPGWAFPQLKVPPSRTVDGPPTAAARRGGDGPPTGAGKPNRKPRHKS